VILLRRPVVLVPCALLLLTAACGEQDDRPTAAATSTTVAATTTTKAPATAAELAWVEGLTALRERLEERTRPQEGVALTQAKMREFIAAGRSCTPSLAKLGTPSARLQGAHRTAEAGCRLYARSAEAWVDAGDWMAVGDADEIQKHLNAASEHGGNGHNRLLVAERQAARAIG
jgi:hypothetical protein